MAENQPPPNGRNAAVSSAETSGDERSILATLNGNRTRKLGRTDDTVKQLEASLDLERPVSYTPLTLPTNRQA